jgi:tRNA(Ile)-lysidine synthase
LQEKDLEQRIQNILRQYNLGGKRLLVGLSGGPDSVCLLHVLKSLSVELKLELVAAHFNHQWRVNSSNDVKFCAQLCKDLEIPLVTAAASNYNAKVRNNGSKEEHARLLRRLFFAEALKQHTCAAVVLAHHAQDQLETFLIRLIRGASLAGLCAMQEFTPPYCRPMLDCSKQDIAAYLAANNFSFMTDSTNKSMAFLRNRIRTQVLPALQAVDKRFENKALATIKNLQQENTVLDALAAKFIHQYPDQKINLLDFKELQPTLQKRVLIKLLIQTQRKFVATTWLLAEMLKFLNSPRGGQHKLGIYVAITKQSKLFWIN